MTVKTERERDSLDVVLRAVCGKESSYTAWSHARGH